VMSSSLLKQFTIVEGWYGGVHGFTTATLHHTLHNEVYRDWISTRVGPTVEYTNGAKHTSNEPYISSYCISQHSSGYAYLYPSCVHTIVNSQLQATEVYVW